MNDMSARLAWCRRRAGLTQQELARRAGVPQPSVARIESGRVRPRIDTLVQLFYACGMQLDLAPLAGVGIDRGPIRHLLGLTPLQRLRLAAREARNLDKLMKRRRTGP